MNTTKKYAGLLFISMVLLPNLAYGESNWIIKINEHHYDEFINLAKNHNDIPKIYDLLVISYSKVAQVTYKYERANDGKIDDITDIRGIWGSISNINYDPSTSIATVIIINQTITIKEIYHFAYLGDGWSDYRPDYLDGKL
jgi:hypothetical protein